MSPKPSFCHFPKRDRPLSSTLPRSVRLSPRCCPCSTLSDWSSPKTCVPTVISRLFPAPRAMDMRCGLPTSRQRLRRLRCVGEIKAGATTEQSAITIGNGRNSRNHDRRASPAGADAVVMVEYAERNGAAVTVHRSVRAGENIVPAGSEARQDSTMVARGTRVNHAIVAIAAAVGRAGDRRLSPPPGSHSRHRRRTGGYQPAARPQRNSQFQQLLAGRAGLCRWW